MDDMTISLIVVGVTALVVISIFMLTRRAKKQKLARIEALAREKGWQFEVIQERLREGYQLKGYNWQMQAIKKSRGQSVEPQQSNLHSETSFVSESLFLPGRNVVIGPRGTQVDLGSFGETLKQKLLQKVLGESGKGMQEVAVGSDEFQRYFMVLANDALDAEKLLKSLERSRC